MAALLVIALALALALRAKVGLSLGPPHALREPQAALDPALARRVDAALAAAEGAGVEDAIRFALAQTGDALWFGLGHGTRLSFGAAPREGNCVEYAHLFAALFNRAAGARGLEARAWAVRSADARLFGVALPHPALRDHDWALVVTRDGGQVRRYFVDPAFADAWLGWDVERNVKAPPRP